MRVKNKIFILTLGLFVASWFHKAFAQAQQPVSYSIKEAVSAALQSNHELIAARHEVRGADARLQEAWGYTLPTIELSGVYTRAIQKPVFFFPNFFAEDSSQRNKVTAIEIGSDHSFDFNVTVSQVLFNSAVFTGVGTAKIYSQAAREVFRSKEIETITKTRKAYYTALLSAEVQAMLHSNLKNAEENYHNALVLAESGLLSEYDRLRAEVALANIRPEVIKAEAQYELALNNLKMEMGVPFDRSIALTDTLRFTPVDPVAAQHADENVLMENASLAALKHQLDINDAIASVERSNFLPNLSAFGNLQYQTQKNDLRISTRDFVNSSLVGLSLSLNVFNGFRTGARVEQAELESRKTEQEIARAENNLKTAVRSTLLTLKRAHERVDAQARTVELAEKGYRIAATRFSSGSGTQLELNDAQLALTTAKTNRMQAIYDYLVASADLDQLLSRKPVYVNSDREVE